MRAGTSCVSSEFSTRHIPFTMSSIQVKSRSIFPWLSTCNSRPLTMASMNFIGAMQGCPHGPCTVKKRNPAVLMPALMAVLSQWLTSNMQALTAALGLALRGGADRTEGNYCLKAEGTLPRFFCTNLLKYAGDENPNLSAICVNVKSRSWSSFLICIVVKRFIQ